MLTSLFIFWFTAYSYATWSIIMIDPKTHQIGIAGASCTFSVYGIGAIVPGKGAIVVQAMSNPAARLKGWQMIVADASPREILKAIKDPMYDPEEQQYAVITVKHLDSAATYTGSEAPYHKGSVSGSGISVQGNTLAHPDELKVVFEAAVRAQKENQSIEDRLMLALEAGATGGGDRRCGDRKAASAFLTVANPQDDRKKPFLNLVVYDSGQDTNAVEALRKKFDQWKLKKEE